MGSKGRELEEKKNSPYQVILLGGGYSRLGSELVLTTVRDGFVQLFSVLLSGGGVSCFLRLGF